MNDPLYIFKYAAVDYTFRLLVTNIPPLTMRRKYTDIVFPWKCFYGNYDVDVNDFDAPLVTRLILDF